MAAQCLRPTVRTTRVPSDNLVSELVEPAPGRLEDLVSGQGLLDNRVPWPCVPDPVSADPPLRQDPVGRPATTSTAGGGGAVA